MVWLEKAATEGWTALTNDTKAATEHADFLSTSGIRLFVIRFKYKNGKDLTKKIIDLLEKIDKYSKSPSPLYTICTLPASAGGNCDPVSCSVQY